MKSDLLVSHSSANCAAFNSKNSLFCFGFSDSSLCLWPELQLAMGHMTSHDPTTSNSMTTTSNQNLPNSSIQPLLGHRGAVYGTCFNSRGQYLLSSSEDCTVRLWDVERRSCVVCYHGHQYPVWNVTFRYIYMYMRYTACHVTLRYIYLHVHEIHSIFPCCRWHNFTPMVSMWPKAPVTIPADCGTFTVDTASDSSPGR